MGVIDHPIIEACPGDFPAIAELNVAAYREFAAQMSPEAWPGMEQSLRAVERRAGNALFLMLRVNDELAGSVGYCPPGRSDPAVFPPEWASMVLLAVAPLHRRCGVGWRLLDECLRRARQDHATTVGQLAVEREACLLIEGARSRHELAEAPRPPV